MLMEFEFRGKKVEVIQGDITKISADAIVNAANEGLRGGGGVDGAVHRAGGPKIMEECRTIGRCPTGTAVITTGGLLAAKYVIHTVGPIWQGGDRREPELLRSAYESSLKLAEENQLGSVAFPSISTGVYGFPIEKACPIAIGVALDHLERSAKLEKITFVLFSKADYDVYLSQMKEILAERS
jgi:O-acetyl-ADP-ribose deacetylase (regulator of RNase III)